MDEGGTRSTVAFVSQVFDVVMEPRLSSVGLVTFALATALASVANVIVFASAGAEGNGGTGRERRVGGVRLRLLPPVPTDLVAQMAWPHLAQVAGWRLPPESSSTLPSRGYLRQLLPELAAVRPDVIHVQHAAHFLPAIRVTCPDALLVVQLHARVLPQSGLRRLRRRLAHADLILGVSDDVTLSTAAMFPELAGRCRTVRNGVDAAAFHAAPPHRAGERRAVGYLGAMSPHKGVHDLVDAFARIAPRRPDVELQLIGPPGAYPLEETYAPGDPRLPTLRPFYAGDYTAALRRRVPPELTTRVRFPGPVPTEDVPARVAGADVFCLPSVWDEGFGLPALEAGAAAVPVVATRAGGLPEVVVHGRTGLLVPQSDPAALAEALARLLDDPPFGRELGRAAAARARDRFSWTVQAETLWERYMAASRRRDAATGSGPRRGTVRLA